MLATAPRRLDSPSPRENGAADPGDLPVKPLPSTTIDDDAQTVRVRAAEPSTTPLPKAISPFDGKTVRLRPIDLPGVGKVANTVGQRCSDLSSLDVRPPSRWEIARVMLVLLLALMPILGISADVFGLVSHSTTSVAVIVLCAALGATITFAPPLLESAPVKQAIASARNATGRA